jgi:hypothetical protein
MAILSDDSDEIEAPHGGGGALFALIVIGVSILALLGAVWGSSIRIQ